MAISFQVNPGPLVKLQYWFFELGAFFSTHATGWGKQEIFHVAITNTVNHSGTGNNL